VVRLGYHFLSELAGFVLRSGVSMAILTKKKGLSRIYQTWDFALVKPFFSFMRMAYMGWCLLGVGKKKRSTFCKKLLAYRT